MGCSRQARWPQVPTERWGLDLGKKPIAGKYTRYGPADFDHDYSKYVGELPTTPPPEPGLPVLLNMLNVETNAAGTVI